MNISQDLQKLSDSSPAASRRSRRATNSSNDIESLIDFGSTDLSLLGDTAPRTKRGRRADSSAADLGAFNNTGNTKPEAFDFTAIFSKDEKSSSDLKLDYSGTALSKDSRANNDIMAILNGKGKDQKKENPNDKLDIMSILDSQKENSSYVPTAVKVDEDQASNRTNNSRKSSGEEMPLFLQNSTQNTVARRGRRGISDKPAESIIPAKASDAIAVQVKESQPVKRPLNILEILDRQYPTKKAALKQSDSVESLPVLSDTDDESILITKKILAKVAQPVATQIPAEKNKIHHHISKELEEQQNRSKELLFLNDSLQKRLESIEAVHRQEIEALILSHSAEITAIKSTHEAALKLKELVNQVANTTEKVSTLQSQLDYSTSESLTSREKSIEMKEIHLDRMQDELRHESKALKEERVKVETSYLEFQEGLKVAKMNEAEALEAVKKESDKIKGEMEKFGRDRDTWLFTFNQEKTSNMLEVENWKLQKETAQIEINRERKDISIIKASLAANEKNTVIREVEFDQKIQMDRQQFDIEYKIFESERRDLTLRIRALNRDEAFLKTERLKMEEKQREIETMSQVFQKDGKDLEFKYSSISNMRDDAVAERNKTEKLQEQIQKLNNELENTRQACEEEIKELKATKQDYIEERVAESTSHYRIPYNLDTSTTTPLTITENEKVVVKPRSTFRIDPVLHPLQKMPKTIWTEEEREIALQLERTLDKEMKIFKRHAKNNMYGSGLRMSMIRARVS